MSIIVVLHIVLHYVQASIRPIPVPCDRVWRVTLSNGKGGAFFDGSFKGEIQDQNFCAFVTILIAEVGS